MTLSFWKTYNGAENEHVGRQIYRSHRQEQLRGQQVNASSWEDFSNVIIESIKKITKTSFSQRAS